MKINVKQPKYVKNAGSWVVTTLNSEKNKKGGFGQSQEWFSTEEEARKYYESKLNEN